MNILFLEDQGGVFDYLIEDLEDKKHTVFVAENITKANYYWREEKIHCIVADMNMAPDGLTNEQQKETHGGLLSGWVWLKYNVFDKDPSMKRRTIIVTAYLDEFDSKLPAVERVGIRVVAKSRNSECDALTMMEHIIEIEKELINEGETAKAD